MIQGTPYRTPDVKIICPIAMEKVTSQEYVGKNNRHKCGTSTVTTDAHRPHSWILAEARSYTNRHTEVRARMFAEACARILAEAHAQTFPLMVWEFLLIVQACTQARVRIFILKARACTVAHPWTFTQ